MPQSDTLMDLSKICKCNFSVYALQSRKGFCLLNAAKLVKSPRSSFIPSLLHSYAGFARFLDTPYII